jgi:predicted HTH domain antitoxin
MAETVSVRIEQPELREIEELSKLEKRKKSDILRDVLAAGIREKRIGIAVEKFRSNETTAWKASRLAGVPLSRFLDILADRGVDAHYGIRELHEDIEGLE